MEKAAAQPGGAEEYLKGPAACVRQLAASPPPTSAAKFLGLTLHCLGFGGLEVMFIILFGHPGPKKLGGSPTPTP